MHDIDWNADVIVVDETADLPIGLKIDLGCGPNKQPGFVGLDRIDFPCVDHLVELGKDRWPFADDSVAEAFSAHCIEHLEPVERIHFFNELDRVLKVGARAKIITPHWSSGRAYGDPTHKWPPVGEFSYLYLGRDWRLGNPERGIPCNAPHTDIAHWWQGYSCNLEVDEMDHGLGKVVAHRNHVFRQFAANHYRDCVITLVVTLIKR